MSNKNKNLGEENMDGGADIRELERRAMEEITILRIEGTLFCFDPREARRRTGTLSRTLTCADGIERPVSIDINARFGQPSVLAYRVVQAIFLKMAEEGYP